jgi:hypothetical protein
MRKMHWSKYSRKQTATKRAPMKIAEADLGPLLGQLLYDPLDERVISQDRGLITDARNRLEGPDITISK